MWKGIAIALLLASALAAGARDAARPPAREPAPPAASAGDEVERTGQMAGTGHLPSPADPRRYTPTPALPRSRGREGTRPFGTVAAGRACDW
jgi:hypothetical protein